MRGDWQIVHFSSKKVNPLLSSGVCFRLWKECIFLVVPTHFSKSFETEVVFFKSFSLLKLEETWQFVIKGAVA